MKIKRWLMAVIACVTAFSVCSMTACGGTDNSGNNGDDNTSIDTTTSGGGDDTNSQTPPTVDDNTPSTGDDNSSDNSSSNDITSSDITSDDLDTVIDNLKTSDIVGAKAKVTGTVSCYNDYTKKPKKYDVYTSDILATALYDYAEYIADVSMTLNEKSAVYGSTSDAIGEYDARTDDTSGLTAEQKCYYAFVREGYTFTLTGSQPVTKYDSSVTLDVGTNQTATDIQNKVFDALQNSSLDSSDITNQLMAFAVIGENYDALSYGVGTIKIDLTKVIKGLYDDVMDMLENLDGTVTVKEIVTDDTIKDLATTLMSTIDAQDIYDKIVSALEDSDYSDAIEYIPQPKDGADLYDYLLALIDDEDFAAKLELDKTLGAYTLNDICQLFGADEDFDISSIATMINTLVKVTQTKDGLKLEVNKQTITINKAVLTYGIGSGLKLSKVTIDLDADYSSYGNSDGSILSSNKYNTTGNVDLTVTLDMYTQKKMPSFTDISACKVNYQQAEYATVSDFLKAMQA